MDGQAAVEMIWADFNARTEDDRVSLETRGSRASLEKTSVVPGDWVWLSDGDLRVGAQIEDRAGKLFARPVWETMEDIIPTDDPRLNEMTSEDAAQQLDFSRGREGFPPDVIFRLAPFLRETPQNKGHVDYLRSRACLSLGYARLALLAIEHALVQRPGFGPYFHHYVRLLRAIDPRRAEEAIQPVLGGAMKDSVAIVAAVEVLGDQVRAARAAPHAAVLDKEILRVTENLDRAAFSKLPDSVSAQIHLARGYAHSHLGDAEAAMKEFDEAVALSPTEPALLIARGIEAYPSDKSVFDFTKAMSLSSAYYWPGYFLTHHLLLESNFAKSQEMAEQALRTDPPRRVQANLLEWLAISLAEQGASSEEVRPLFIRALHLSPGTAHIQQNLQLYETIAKGGNAEMPPSWALMKDEAPRSYEYRYAEAA